MLTPSLNTVMTRLLIVAAVLGTVVFFAPAIFAQEANIQYSENGTDAVRTFVSEDPEGAGIDWDVTGLDADDFTIDSRGMLMFNSSPNFESPTDRDDPATTDVDESAGENSNKYQITVRATERDGTTNRALSTEQHFTVEVMNEDEDGEITLDWIQPEVGTEITATLSDPDKLTNDAGDELRDGDDEGISADEVAWQWSYSKVTSPQIDIEGHWADAQPGTTDGTLATALSSAYTPMGDCVDNKGETTVTPQTDGCTNTVDPDESTARDEGKYLRVKAVYTDRKGAGKIALVMSDNPVRAEVSTDLDNVENPANGSPGFTQGLDYTRSVPESTATGMPVGAAVSAVDPNDDTLSYDLLVDHDRDGGTTALTTETEFTEGDNTYNTDLAFFSVDKATGQLMVNRTLSYEATDGRDYEGENAATAGTYEIVVRAVDPSGETAAVTVTITASAANDAPVIMGSLDDYTAVPLPATPAPSELRVYEKDDDLKSPGDYTGFPQMPLPGNTPEENSGNDTPGLGASNVFTASDEDTRGQIFWSVRGEDADDFVLSSTGIVLTGYTGPDEPTALRFVNAPDYENPTDSNMDSVYKVTVVARDSAGAEDTKDITVFVMNVNEAGEAELSMNQPLIGQAITAEVSDPDNSVTIVTWQWARSNTRGGDYTPIPGATTATYVPWTDDDEDTDDDDSMFLRATATYLDTTSVGDMLGTGSVDERVQTGDDTDGPAAKVISDSDSDGVYRVTVTSANAVRVSSDTADVAPVFTGAPYERTVAENAETDTIVGLPVIADYTRALRYTINNADANDNKYFEIDENNGQIRVSSIDVPDPTPSGQLPVPEAAEDDADVANPDPTDPVLDFETKDSYTLVITGTDAQDPGRRTTATVVVNLENQNEAPYFDKDSRDKVETFDATSGGITPITQMYAENRRTAVLALAAIEPDGDALRWELTGADASAFMIDDIADGSGTRDRVELVFKNQPNFETRGGPDEEQYMVTVRATEEMDSVSGGPAKAATLKVTVQVTNVNETGSVAITWLQPEVNTALPAVVSDPDGPATGDTITVTDWQWYRAKVGSPNSSPNLDTLTATSSEWELIGDASGSGTNTYTPQGKTAGTDEPAVDEGWHLLVVATYTDGATEADDDPRMAFGITANAVRADVANADNNSPDFRESSTTRTVAENIAGGSDIGRPVMVNVNEDNDTLTYQLQPSTEVAAGDPGTDAVTAAEAVRDLFDIDKSTGQISLKQNAKLSYETDGEAAGEYEVVVRATDPSGEENEDSDVILVKIVATDVNEAPGVAGLGLAELEVDEVNSSDNDYFVGLGNTVDENDNIVTNGSTGNLYQRTEQDLVDSTSWPEPIGGADGALFEYSVPADAQGIGRRLHFKQAHLPDFETPMDANRDNVYEVTINVVDTQGATGQKNIRITVNNVDETGKLTVTPAQPHLGGMAVAALTDPDGVESITDWNWYAGPTNVRDAETTSLIPGATMNYYVPKGDAIVGQFLWAEVAYRDGESVEDDPVTALDERNDAPEGAVLADGSTDDGSAIQTLYDSDRMLSKQSGAAVQQAPPSADPAAYPAMTINLEVAETTPSTGYVGAPVLSYDPTKAESQQDRRVDVGGPDGALFVFAEDYDAADDDYYDAELQGAVDPNNQDNRVDYPVDKFGQLALKPVTHLDHEGGKNTYVVEVMDADAANELGVITVMITVTDVNERPSAPAQHFGPGFPTNTAPEFQDANGDMATSTYRMVAENTDAGMDIGDPVAAMDADRGDTLSYELGGADAASFAIDSETGQLMTSAALDYETKMEYMVTVTATDSDGETDMIYVTINVTNVGLDNAYDMDDSGDISRDEVIMAIDDFLFGDGSVTRDDVIAVIDLFLFG